MSYIKKSLAGVTATMIGVAALLAIAMWQFYLFVTFKNASGILDMQGGRGHLWAAVIAAVLACVAGFVVFSVFLRYDRDDEMHITSNQ
jgi:hypothetical protein